MAAAADYGLQMRRTRIAILATILFVLAYIVAAITLPDYLPQEYWAVQALYWLVAGTLWVFPVWWLMIWARR